MENAVDALKIGFAVLVFVIALSITIISFALIRQTSDVVIMASDKTNYYEYVGDDTSMNNNKEITRTVGVETIIPTLYRYLDESLSIKILDKKGNFIQIFDLNIENGNNITSCSDKIQDCYSKNVPAGDDLTPWSVGIEQARKRIDLFINGTGKLDTDEKKINGVEMEYEGFYEKYKNEKFVEKFKEEEQVDIAYYDSELSGGVSAVSKTIIEYQLQ